MSDRTARGLAWALFGVELVLFGIGVWLTILIGSHRGDVIADVVSDAGYLLAFVLLFPGLGVVLATRRPRNPLGWLMLVVGFFAVEPLSIYGTYALETGRSGAGAAALAVTSWTWVPVIGISGVFVLLLFPDGHLPSPRWRWFAWAVAIGMVMVSLAIFFGPGDLADFDHPELRNPFGIEAFESFIGVFYAALLVIPLGILGGAWSLVVRFRRSGPIERLQIRWLATAAVIVAILYGGAMATSIALGAAWGGGDDPGWILAIQNAAILSFGLLPISIGVAVLRYRLYEIDVVIRKAVIVTAIAAFFTVVYLAVVGGIGALVESRSTTALSFISAAVVAALFQPVLRRARRLADRVVYGKRATPYEVLAEFSERVGETYAADDVLPRMARVVAEGVGASRADVWLRVGDRLRVAATWPSDAEPRDPVAFAGDELPELPGADASFRVEHHGEVFGALSVTMRASDPMDEAKSRLIDGLATQGGLVMRNVRLSEDLRLRLEDLKAAQKRLVAAQDQERRRLERNIHDGAQQQLVALAVKIRLVDSLVGRDDEKAHALLADLQSTASEALDDLRDLARGVYPPLLADKGLAEALAGQATRSVVPIEIAPDGIGRYAPEVEAAVYFSVLEALQNVAKYAGASHAVVRLGLDGRNVTFEVEDDGIGFDPSATSGTGLQGIADRLGALDGSVEVRSAPGQGTVISGRIPVGEA